MTRAGKPGNSFWKGNGGPLVQGRDFKKNTGYRMIYYKQDIQDTTGYNRIYSVHLYKYIPGYNGLILGKNYSSMLRHSFSYSVHCTESVMCT